MVMCQSGRPEKESEVVFIPTNFVSLLLFVVKAPRLTDLPLSEINIKKKSNQGGFPSPDQKQSNYRKFHSPRALFLFQKSFCIIRIYLYHNPNLKIGSQNRKIFPINNINRFIKSRLQLERMDLIGPTQPRMPIRTLIRNTMNGHLRY